MSTTNQIKLALQNSACPIKATGFQRFFKTTKGQYGYGDIFIGVNVPYMKKIAKEYTNISLDELQNLISSKIHEERATALYILVNKYKKAKSLEQENIVKFYLQNIEYINNWDLVDLSCYFILGHFYHGKNEGLFLKLANSNIIWERRIAIVSQLYSIRTHNYLDDAIIIAEQLLNDKHDLIHKASGWVIREIGKKDESRLISFLNKHAAIMPRTMLRYAIEKLPPNIRQYYLNLAIRDLHF